MTEIHDDFIEAARALMRNGGGVTITVIALAAALQKQYRTGFKDGQRDGEQYERTQQAYARY